MKMEMMFPVECCYECPISNKYRTKEKRNSSIDVIIPAHRYKVCSQIQPKHSSVSCICDTQILFDLFAVCNLHIHTHSVSIRNVCTLIHWDCHNTHKFPVICVWVIIICRFCSFYWIDVLLPLHRRYQMRRRVCQFDIWTAHRLIWRVCVT